jgi:hypothetical protein
MKPCLYPINTQLITRRLSQVALAYELGFLIELPVAGFYLFEEKYDEWRITVTAENQKWLSPVPMVGDKIQYHQDPHGSVYVSNIVFIDDEILDLKADPSTDAETYEGEISIYQVHDILKRTYPNGQRAPLLEWDEVILPQQGASS